MENEYKSILLSDPMVPRALPLFRCEAPDDEEAKGEELQPDFNWPNNQQVIDAVKMKTLETWWSNNVNNGKYSLTQLKVTLSDGTSSELINCGHGSNNSRQVAELEDK